MSNSIPRRSNTAAVTPAQSVDYSEKRGQWQLCGCLVINETEANAIKAKPTGVPSVFRNLVQGDLIVLRQDTSENHYAPNWRHDNDFSANPVFAEVPQFRLKDVLTSCLDPLTRELDPKKAEAFAKTQRSLYVGNKVKASESVLAML